MHKLIGKIQCVFICTVLSLRPCLDYVPSFLNKSLHENSISRNFNCLLGCQHEGPPVPILLPAWPSWWWPKGSYAQLRIPVYGHVHMPCMLDCTLLQNHVTSCRSSCKFMALVYGLYMWKLWEYLVCLLWVKSLVTHSSTNMFIDLTVEETKNNI